MKYAFFGELKLKAEVDGFIEYIGSGFFRVLSVYYLNSYVVFMTSGQIEQIGFILL